MRTPEAERVVNPQCFPKDNAWKTTWKFLSVETDCFKFIFFIFWCFSVSHAALTVNLFSRYFCASWPVHHWCILIPVKSRDLQFVAARRQLPSPQHAPRYQQLSVKESHGSSLQTYVVFVIFPAGKCMYFLRLHFGRLATGLRPVLLSFTFLCYPRATFVWRVPTIFLHLSSLLMLCLVGWYQAHSGSCALAHLLKHEFYHVYLCLKGCYSHHWELFWLLLLFILFKQMWSFPHFPKLLFLPTPAFFFHGTLEKHWQIVLCNQLFMPVLP